MIERIFAEMSAVLEELEDEYGEELLPHYGDFIKSFLAKELSERLGRVVKDSEIILAEFFLIARRNFEEMEETIAAEIHELFETFRKIDKKKY